MFALEPLTLPEESSPMYELPKGYMEYGIGIHGEKGKQLLPVSNYQHTTQKMISDVLSALPDDKGKDILLFVNGLGGMSLLQLHVIYKKAHDYLESIGYKVQRSLVGNYTTALNTTGYSISITILSDDFINYWDSEVQTPTLNW